MKQQLLCLLGSIVLFGAVSGCSGIADRPGTVQVRVANRSTQDFDRVTITFPSGKMDYGQLAKGAVTDYRPVEKAYRYAQVDAVVNGKSLTLQPQDYMGETPLAPGQYTYNLELDESGETLKLELAPQ